MFISYICPIVQRFFLETTMDGSENDFTVELFPEKQQNFSQNERVISLFQ